MYKRVLNLSLVFALLFLALSTGIRPVQAAASSDGPGDPAELGAFLDGVFADRMEADHVPGAVVAVVKDGEVLYLKGYGYADLATLTPVDPQKTLFRPGSVSKLFVWTAVMQLVEQGKLSLDADVNTYLDFKIPATYPQPITMKNLLTHTPGFEDIGQDLFKLKADELTPLDVYLKTHVPARVFPPGTIGAYSNYGAALAGYIVERVSGMPFSDYVEKNILQPLDMTHSTFVQPLPAGLAPDMASGYNYINGGYVQGGFEYVVPYPAGSMSATAADMAKFMIAHLQNGRYGDARILSEETARRMHTQLFTHDPRLLGMAYGFFESDTNGQRVVSHGGDTLLFHSGLFLLTGQNVGLFVSTNGVGGAKTSEAVFKAFMDRYYPVPPQAEPVPPADMAARAAQYSGEYTLSRSNFTGGEKFLSLLQSVMVSVDSKGYVVASMGGETSRYVETEPGLLRSVDDPSQAAVLKTGDDGRTYLLASGPFAYIKAPWVATLEFNGLLFVGGLLLFLGTLTGWLLAFLSGLIHRRRIPLGARLARIAAALFMLVFVIYLIGFLGTVANVDPAYGVPALFFGTPPGFDFIVSLALVLAVLAILVLPFVFLAWKNRYWTVAGRLYYTLLAVWFWGTLLQLHYWNLLL